MERKDLLSTLFYLAAFWTYINFTKTRSSGSYLASLVLFGAGHALQIDRGHPARGAVAVALVE